MHEKFLCLLLCVWCIGVGFTDLELQAQSSAGPSIDSIVGQVISVMPAAVSISIALVEGDSVKFSGYLQNGQKEDMADSFFEIGSITKVMTSIVLSAMIEENKVSADTPLKDIFHLNYKDPQVGDITLAQLSNHTSGLARMPADFKTEDPSNPYAAMDLNNLLSSLAGSSVVSQPGEVFGYSNFGAAILAQALVLTSGVPFEDLLGKYVFGKCQMNLSTSILKKLDKGSVVPGLGWGGTPTAYWSFNAYEGAGAVYSSAREMSNFIRMNIQDTGYVSAIRKSTFVMDNGAKIGMAILQAPSEPPFYWHNGGTGGFRSCFAFDVQNNRGVVVLSNISAYYAHSAKIDELCFTLLRAIQ